METLVVERDGHVVHVRLNRPAKLNAQTHQMWYELRQVGAELGEDTSIRALVLSGEGRSFCAGLDVAVLTDFFADAAAPDLEGLRGTALVRKVQSSFTWLADAPYPTIAAVQGHALGAGCQLALACDLRLAADDAVFGLLETNWGLLPDLGGTVWLPQLVGPAKAKELMWLGDTIDAAEAHRLGMVNRLVPKEDLAAEAEALARRLATRPPLAVRGIKRAVAAALVDDEASLEVAGEEQLRCLASNDVREAGLAWFERRDPVYTGT